ncbi:MAG: MDR family oxidoreductase [Acidobacteriota bacterium]
MLVTQPDGKFAVDIQDMDRSMLAEGEVLVRVAYSSLNYKDGLAVTGKPGVIRNFPMVPGIDFAGVVEESSSDEFRAGDSVVITGCGTGETIWGGYSQYARLDAKCIVPLPQGMSLQQAMAIGTAGFTAMQSVMALEHHGLKPDSTGEVLVTGAAGGVGSTAVAILAKLGYKVAASTGRPEYHDYLRDLGATSILDRAELQAPSKRPLDSERWAAAIDSVGGDTLAAVLRSVFAHGSVAACGLAGGAALNTTVFPFILRGVNLLGIDSPKVDKPGRLAIWSRLATDMPLDLLNEMTQVVPLKRVFDVGELIIAGKIRGRTVIDVNAFE